MTISRGLIIDSPHIDNILSGRKTWELRSTATRQRGLIALIRKGSGQIIGTVDLHDCRGPLSDEELGVNRDKHLRTAERMNDPSVAKYRYAWELRSARVLSAPVPYSHPSGAVIWVKLDPETMRRLQGAR